MKHILLPTDFSENASNAFLYAFKLYKDEACRFIFLHSYKVDGYQKDSKLSAIPDEATLEKAHKVAEEKLQTLMEELNTANPEKGHSYSIVAVNDPLIPAIQQQIKEQDIELVVIGTQGVTGAYEVVYGSNTINIMEEIQGCPVLTVPADINYKPIEEIVLVNGFKLELTHSDLQYLKNLAQTQNAVIRILHIAEEGGLSDLQKKNKERLDQQLNDIPHTFHSLEYLSIPLGIYSFTESRGSELITFINKKHSFIENVLFNPLYKNLGHYSKVPLLVLHYPQNTKEPLQQELENIK